MALNHLSLAFSSSLVLAARLGAGCLRLAASRFYGHLSFALGAVLVLARRLSVFGVATVNPKFQPNSKALGLGDFRLSGSFRGPRPVSAAGSSLVRALSRLFLLTLRSRPLRPSASAGRCAIKRRAAPLTYNVRDLHS